MDSQSGSTRFQELFESALQAYEKKTGISLPKHPLAEQLQRCHSVEDITALVQDQASTFSESKGKDRIIKSIKGTISILATLSAIASFGDVVGLVSQKGSDACSTSLTVFYSHSHPRKQYTLALPSYLLYVPSCIFHVIILLTSTCIRLPRT
jgi:hypothetical protein